MLTPRTFAIGMVFLQSFVCAGDKRFTFLPAQVLFLIHRAAKRRPPTYTDGYKRVYIPLTLTLSRKGRGNLRSLPSLDLSACLPVPSTADRQRTGRREEIKGRVNYAKTFLTFTVTFLLVKLAQ